jgi:hypothetical protein
MTMANQTKWSFDMSHYRALLDPGIFLGPQDFVVERPVTISRIIKGEMPTREKEKASTAPMLFILQKDGIEYPRCYKVPKSVLFGLSCLLGTETDAWKGKQITLFSCFCMSFGTKEECVRVKFPPEIDEKVFTWLRKRKTSASVYMLREGQ